MSTAKRLRGTDRRPQLTAAALTGLAHIAAAVGNEWPVPLDKAACVAAARDWIAHTLAHHESEPAKRKRATNVANVKAYRARIAP